MWLIRHEVVVITGELQSVGEIHQSSFFCFRTQRENAKKENVSRLGMELL